jgi:UDP-N-acetylglucosamine:LPS N-acetylglucosamine transferase
MLNKKAVIIPISWVSHSEQKLNADLANKEIGSRVIEESLLNSEVLSSAIEAMSKIPKRKLPAKLENDVAERIMEIIQKELS